MVEAYLKRVLCDQMYFSVTEVEYPFEYYDSIREFGITIFDGGSSHMMIEYCPYCGERLPESLEGEWVRALAQLGYDDPFDSEESIPAQYQSGKWWRDLGL
ncbi:DUF6980 family protein [Calidifontibacter terrae]